MPPTKSVDKLSADDSLRSYTVQQCAELLAVGGEQVRAWIRTGELFAFKSNSAKNPVRFKYRIPTYALKEFMHRRAAVAGEAASCS